MARVLEFELVFTWNFVHFTIRGETKHFIYNKYIVNIIDM